MATEIKIEISIVSPEHRALVGGASHACRHIAEKLRDGEPVEESKDFAVPANRPRGDWVAACRPCAEYICTHQPNKA